MGIARGPNIVRDGLVFGYDTGYGIADNNTATMFYPGEPTTNLITTNLETLGTDGSGQSSVGTRTTIAPNHVRIVDVASNTRQTHLIQGLTASTTYTVSIQFKKLSGTPTFRFQLQGYNGSSYVNTIKFTTTAETGIQDIEGWQLAKWTFTLPSNANALRIWWQDGADYTTYTHSFELKNPQLEAKGHATPYVSGTRSSTASLIDLKRNTNIDLSSVSFNSTGQPTFDGTDDYINVNKDFGDFNEYTIEYVVNTTTNGKMPIAGRTNTNFYKYGAYSWRYKHGGTLGEYYHTAGTVTGWSHWVITYDGDLIKVFQNNVSLGTNGASSGGADFSDGFKIGSWSSASSYSFNGDIPIMRVYDKALTSAEIEQNFKIYKKRFNI